MSDGLHTNNPMVAYNKFSQNNFGQRTYTIDHITPRCVVDQCTAEELEYWLYKSSIQVLSNYGIDKDDCVGMYV